MKIAACTVMGAISGIRSIHLIHGKPDFTRYNGRYKILLNALKRGVVPKQKTPLPVEVLEKAWGEYTTNGGSDVFLESLTAAVTAFSFLLRGQEVANLGEKDITFGEADGVRFVTLLISRSKTDQDGKGVYRSLITSSGPLCVVKSLARWLTKMKWNPEGSKRVFGTQILRPLKHLLQWMCTINGLPVGMYSIHSFRVGGAASLHCNGVPFEAIRRFGRWISDCFKIYLHNDEIALRYLGSKLGKTTAS